MTTKTLGRGLGSAVMVLAVVGLPTMKAYADATCYVGCTTTTTSPQTSGGGGHGGSGGSGGSGGTRPPVTKSSGGSGTSGSGSSGGGVRTTAATGSSGGSLPFTGADVEELTAGGVGALVVGGVLLRRSRNRRRAEA
ncbi:MAG TPA: hypothetical protein VN796_09435 [Acidimicrobiales bacterium]|nr:hypothetical protein [Acidimicrobiales bacterium]